MNNDDNNIDNFLRQLKLRGKIDEAPINIAFSQSKSLKNDIHNQYFQSQDNNNSNSIDDILKDINTKTQVEAIPISAKGFTKMVRNTHKIEATKAKANLVSKHQLSRNSSQCIINQSKKSDQILTTANLIDETGSFNKSCLSSISHLNSKLSLAKSNNSQINKFFASRRFCFVPYSVTLTKRRVEIMSDLIIKKDGVIVEASELLRLEPHEVIIITSKDIPTFEVLKKHLPKNMKNIEEYTFIDCEWISQCMVANMMLNHVPFCIHLSSINSKNTMFDDIMISPFNIESTIKNEENQTKGEFKTKIGNSITVSDDEHEEYLTLEKMRQLKKKFKVGNKQKSLIDSRYLFDYLYEDELWSKDQVKMENRNKFDTELSRIESKSEYIDKSPIKTEDELDTEELTEQDLEILGIKKKKTTYDKDSAKGTLIDGIENLGKVNTNFDGETQEIKMFKSYMPNNKKAIEFWSKKKDTFVCQSGTTKHSYNDNITQVKYFINSIKIN